MIRFPLIAISLATLSCSAVSRAAPGSRRISLPTPKDLCKDPAQRRIRKRVNTAVGGTLVPCKHGTLRYLQLRLRGQDILLIAEEDLRPSYISGGSHKRSFALIGNSLVGDFDELWKKVRSKNKLRDADMVGLLVVAAMFRGQPNTILNDRQRKAVVSWWPEAERAFKLAPPGLQLAAGRHALQAWVVHGYSERGVSCRYIEGWHLTLDRAAGLTAKRNHQYAAGSDMGDPCGKPLPPP